MEIGRLFLAKREPRYKKGLNLFLSPFFILEILDRLNQSAKHGNERLLRNFSKFQRANDEPF